MEENVIYVIESQDYIFVADTLEKAEEIADRLAIYIFGDEEDFKREYIKKYRNLECDNPYDRTVKVRYDDGHCYRDEYIATINVCKMNFCRYDKNGKRIKGHNFGEEV